MATAAETYKPIPVLNDKDYVRFWSKAELTANPDKCWIWQKSVDTGGYGSHSIGGRNYTSNRVAYASFYKKDPGNFHVLHKCDCRRCINPHHLFLGTNYDNVKDKMAKGRQGRPIGKLSGSHTHPEKILKGSKIGTSKLTEDQVLEIRKRHKEEKLSTYKLANIYKVSQALIWYAVNNKTWKHI